MSPERSDLVVGASASTQRRSNRLEPLRKHAADRNASSSAESSVGFAPRCARTGSGPPNSRATWSVTVSLS
jgi:hypothetical protein